MSTSGRTQKTRHPDVMLLTTQLNSLQNGRSCPPGPVIRSFSLTGSLIFMPGQDMDADGRCHIDVFFLREGESMTAARMPDYTLGIHRSVLAPAFTFPSALFPPGPFRTVARNWMRQPLPFSDNVIRLGYVRSTP